MLKKNENMPKQDNPEIKDADYWRSFEDFYKNPKTVESSHHEFKDGVTKDFNPSELSHISRRKFLALVGASAALAGAGCADYPDKGEIIPYNKKPEEVTLGKPNYYASTSTACSHTCGILIKTREGRPIKVEGNPDHPVNKGKVCLKCQAEILNLYDPERLIEPLQKVSGGVFVKSSWKKVDEAIISVLNKIGDKEITIISNKINSPTTLKVLNEFSKKYPTSKIYSYELFHDEIKNASWEKCYGSDFFPLIKWNEAKVILGLESDFLGSEGNRVETSALFVEGRDVSKVKNFNRLYVVEGNLSLTGMNADHRFRLRPDAQFDFVMSLINDIGKRVGKSLGINTGNFSISEFSKKYEIPVSDLNSLVSDLIKNQGKSIVHSGPTLPEEVHIAVNYLNELLGNKALYRPDIPETALFPLTKDTEWINLIANMKAGNVSAVIHFNSNPVFHLPDDYDYEKALSKVPMVISFTEKENESSEIGNYVLPINHDFESWGDYKTRAGFYSLQQPVIAPLYNSRQKEAILLTWTNGKTENYSDKIYHEYLVNKWKDEVFPTLNSALPFDRFWFSALHDGVVKVKESTSKIESFNLSSMLELNSYKPVSTGCSIILKNNYSIGDGKFADNGWLQELPHPVSKITWDNYASVSFNTAKELGLNNNDLVEITVGSRKLKIPVFLQPGSADKTITIELGYGRRKTGTVGSDVGFDASVLQSKDSSSTYLFEGEVIKITGSHELVTAQEHYMFDNELTKDAAIKRNVIREGTVDQYLKNPKFLKNESEVEPHTVYPFIAYPEVKWGMSIDLNKCLGCGDCVVACTSENNIPIVGKEQVSKGREMHWIRIDRYYSGSVDDPNTSLQPMLCQHCDHAPCENVCPVAATTHSPDGLNQMAYNRCVGTRYCSNNCPYKVRRFNFFNFRDHFKDAYQASESFNLIYNPEVTVRSRGVMEKCTFCIQRIMDAREEAIRQNTNLKGSDVNTACQVACNTNAIKFGDINDAESEFHKYRNHELGYYVLEELNIKPNVTYIAKLRNTHSEEA